MGFLSELTESMFFRGTSLPYWSAQHYGLETKFGEASVTEKESVQYQVLQPKLVKGQVSKGFVFFFHSGQFNMSYNMQQVAYLALDGYAVALFDYRGIGHSSGSTTLAGIEEDAQAVWVAINSDPENKEKYKMEKVAVFGQGVGADAALRFSIRHQNEIKALIVESIYATRQGWLRERYGPVVGDVTAKLLNCSAVEPIEILPELKCPLVLVKPQRDDYVRKNEQALVSVALPEQAEIWEVPGKNYLGVFSDNNSPFREKFTDFLKTSFK